MNRLVISSITTLFLWGSTFGQATEKKAAAPVTPNFVVIVADDAGWNDVGYNGSEIHTPNIDWLAKNGAQLNRMYAAPTCSPSRASFFTGRPSSRMGIVAPISDKSNLSLPSDVTTLPQALHQQNYQTALFGKWHLGLNPSSGPKVYGFDYSYGFLHGQIDQYSHEYKNGDPSWHRNGQFITEKGHVTDLVENEAITWLKTKRDPSKNFYIQLSYSAPHFPLQEEDKWKKPYLKTIKNNSRRDYAAAMSHLDYSIGQILKTLKQQHLDKNTVVIFMSDNGAMDKWIPGNQYQGRHAANDVLGSNYPLRDWKTTNYEGAVRIPAIIYWKNKINSSLNQNYISVTDLMPTILSLAGAKSLPKTIEGKNIWNSIVSNDSIPNQSIYIRGHLQESITEKPWKLIRTRHKNAPAVFELFNIEKDPEEKENLVLTHSSITDKLKQDLEVEFAKDSKEVNSAGE
ncbi:sulfatase-like hydrolase/transferase [Flavobacterium sp. GSA192]|uniref:sulfatase-like hydrolase/transferase n=1 Tax=Flavobacterium sp. GSA192 TaxID=2576304 RepID=UPI0011297307|nr:sulfatase-like hydrolase/transferase [Flavobacterium sp. GSA192]